MSSFKDVVGHKNIIQYIENAVKTDKVSHAYILNGEKGSGKRLLANLFAMSLQCQNRDEDGDACGKCQSCKQAASNNQPDIIRVTHEKPNTISIDDIREQINNDIVIKPYSSKYKIYIVPDADMMSVQAQNALSYSYATCTDCSFGLTISPNIFFGSYGVPFVRIAKITLSILQAITTNDCFFFSGLSFRVV